MVFVDLVGPFTIRTPSKTHSLLALKMIDPAIKLHGYHAIRSTYHKTLQAAACQFMFGRDMIHNFAFRLNRDKIQ
jgi:hypothetical protein